jgi:hypothetical protein
MPAHPNDVLEICIAAGCEKAALHTCSVCKTAKYCSEVCQKADWKAGHKAACSAGSLTVKTKVRFPDGIAYDAEFTRGTLNGRGRMTFSDGMFYEGEMFAGRPHGRGRTVSPDGMIYEGDFRHAKRHGRGRVTTPDGRAFDSEWKDDFPSSDPVEVP